MDYLHAAAAAQNIIHTTVRIRWKHELVLVGVGGSGKRNEWIGRQHERKKKRKKNAYSVNLLYGMCVVKSSFDVKLRTPKIHVELNRMRELS